EMTVDEAVEFFAQDSALVNRNIVEILSTLQRIGLGYIKLGQSTSTLSGGEIQRIKLASFLLKEGRAESTMFIFDEPTTGLHMHDIEKLLRAFDALIEKGHTIVVVEHNLDVIKCADWLIDLGPEAGDGGGELVYEGTPMGATECEQSYTGKFLKERLKAGKE
ncbi:MAG: ATP-binding cassette domain-containing protein, partial [Tidjanibacter sp.]|nr:ATP-binding cassette domain-containing protein [Tidjanibacter sp.]